MILNLILLGLILFLLLVLSMVWPPDSPWAPWWRTNKKTARAICKLAKISKKDIVYDLGCGDGEVLIQSALLGARGVGIEIDPIRAFLAKFNIIKNRLEKRIIIKRKNFFQEDISEASIVVVYLVPKALEKLLPKFKKELKKGTKIISFVYEIKYIKPNKIDAKNRLYLYII